MPIVLGIITLAILLVIGMRLAERLGHPFWYGLALGIPVVNLFVLAFFAFTPSPREQRLAEIEAELADLRRGPPPRLAHDPVD
jgi:hypothetical protein